MIGYIVIAGSFAYGQESFLDLAQEAIVAKKWTMARDLLFQSIEENPSSPQILGRVMGFYRLLPTEIRLKKVMGGKHGLNGMQLTAVNEAGSSEFFLTLDFETDGLRSVRLKGVKGRDIQLTQLKKNQSQYTFLAQHLSAKKSGDLYHLVVEFVDGASLVYQWLMQPPEIEISEQIKLRTEFHEISGNVKVSWLPPQYREEVHYRSPIVSHAVFADSQRSSMVYSKNFDHPMTFKEEQSFELGLDDLFARTKNETYFLLTSFISEESIGDFIVRRVVRVQKKIAFPKNK